MDERTWSVIINYVQTIIIVFLDFAFAFIFVKITRDRCPQLYTERKRFTYLIFGTGLLLVAGIGRLGWQFETVVGSTLADILNNLIFFKWSSLAGTFLIFINLIYNFIKYRSEKNKQEIITFFPSLGFSTVVTLLSMHLYFGKFNT